MSSAIPKKVEAAFQHKDATIIAMPLHTDDEIVDAMQIHTNNKLQVQESQVDNSCRRSSTPEKEFPDRQSEVIHDIFNDLYNENDLRNEIVESSGSTCYEECVECCFLSCSKHINKMTDTLRRAKKNGRKFFFQIAFPLFPDVMRDIWVSLQLFTVIVGLSLSIATLSLDYNSSLSIVHLIFSCLSTFLALLDGFFVLKQCRSCRACCGKKRKHDKKFCFCSCCKGASDVLRMILSELLIYSLLICSIFSVTAGKTYEGKDYADRFGFTLFVISCLSLIFYTYVIRIIAVVRIIKIVKDVRVPSSEVLRRNENVSYDPSIAKSAFSYQIYFLIHIFLQMVVQVLMIVAIDAKIQLIDGDFYHLASGHLWYMIVIGYIAPLMGLFSFFVVTYHWYQEFLIGLCIDIIQVWKLRSKEDVLDIHTKLGLEQQNTFDHFFKTESLVKEFDELRNISRTTKFAYPFTSPALIFFCVCYGLLLISFVICAGTTYNDMGFLIIHILNGGGWVIYYIVACIIGLIANIYILLVAGVWIILIAFIILVIAGFMAVVLVIVVVLAALGVRVKN